jgi:hypothetical protein
MPRVYTEQQDCNYTPNMLIVHTTLIYTALINFGQRSYTCCNLKLGQGGLHRSMIGLPGIASVRKTQVGLPMWRFP